jgi:hypothetical protein
MILCEGLPQKDNPGLCCVPLYAFVSYRRLSPQFKFSLSAVTLGIYLGGYDQVTFLLQPSSSSDMDPHEMYGMVRQISQTSTGTTLLY